ncbi:LolA family protein [Runella sp.]|uniref:LolA family protein n=1 Tax=Runella sp. TaxID=1960881 RepID=UPI003D0E2A72
MNFVKIAFWVVFATVGYAQEVRKVSASMTMRTNHKGKTTNTRAELCYATSGRMVTQFPKPSELYLFNNANGELRVYDPTKNTVLQQQNATYSTETTQFFFFLHNRKADLGLSSMGFSLGTTKFENGVMITTWKSPTPLAKNIKRVELVHKGQNPIFMKYVDPSERTIKKVFYYDYMKLGTVDFPQTITQIDYVTAKDSIVTKTAYGALKINEQVQSNLLEFTIPSNAKVIK